jgi:hypothetical protein
MVLKLELDLAVGPKKPFPQVEEELEMELEEPRQQKRPPGQEGLQQAVDPPNAVLLLVMMNAREADQQNHQSPYRRGLISFFFDAHLFGD